MGVSYVHVAAASLYITAFLENCMCSDVLKVTELECIKGELSDVSQEYTLLKP